MFMITLFIMHIITLKDTREAATNWAILWF